MTRRERYLSRTAWTLIEMLMVVAIVALLLVLLAPSLRPIRNYAEDAADMSKLSGHASAFLVYTSDYRDYWPIVTDPRATATVLRADGAAIEVRYFDAITAWNFALSETLGGTSWRDPSFVSSVRRGRSGSFTSFWHTSTLLADPAFWDLSTRVGPAQWRGTKAHEVSFPSHKALLTRMDPWPVLSRDGEPSFCVMALSDGHAVRKEVGKITPPVFSGEGNWTGSFLNSGVPTLHTPDGLRGRDLP